MLPKIPFIAQIGAGSVAQQVKVLAISGAYMAQREPILPSNFLTSAFALSSQ